MTMQLTVLQENLAHGLATVGRAVATRSSLPILSNVLLEAEGTENGGRLRLAATDLGIGVNTWLDARLDEAPGSPSASSAITVPARLLTEFVNALPPGQIHIELTERTWSLNLKCAGHEANIKGIDPEEFPEVPTYADLRARAGDGNPQHAGTLARLITQTAFAVAPDESRPILTGTLARFHNDTDGDVPADALTLAAADGFRLAVTTAQAEQWVGAGIDDPACADPAVGIGSIIIPGRALAELGRHLNARGGSSSVDMLLTPIRNQVLFHLHDDGGSAGQGDSPAIDIVSQLIDGNFPDYTQIIPKGHTTRTIVETADILKVARVALLFARDAANIIKFHIRGGSDARPGQITVTATSAEFGNNVSDLDADVDADVDGTGIEIAFNARYLIDALTAVGTTQVALETTVPSNPVVLRPIAGHDFLCVVMPMHISN